MHLLNVYTGRLEEFFGDGIPPYAILSHTWGEGEVSFQDLKDPSHTQKPGYAKIEGCCQQAIRDGLDFVWIDTCCIDKRSSAELSEAINSMFRWYGEAKICYVYLADVTKENLDASYSALGNSKWFTRGWTLQELIAPVILEFFDTTWTTIFKVYKGGFANRSAKLMVGCITGIEQWTEYSIRTLDTTLRDVPVATKFSWASGRSTSRVEDMAYCLLGLLDVSMPLLYGEGNRAFLRLQEEFLKKYFDPSILLRGFGLHHLDIKDIESRFDRSYLAPTPSLFRGFRNVGIKRVGFPVGGISQPTWIMTPYGLRVDLPVLRVDARNDGYVFVTNYTIERGTSRGRRLSVLLRRSQGSDIYRHATRIAPMLLGVSTRWFKRNVPIWKTVYLDIGSTWYADLRDTEPWQLGYGILIIDMKALIEHGFVIDSMYPPAVAVAPEWGYPRHDSYLAIVLHIERRVYLYILLSRPITVPTGHFWKKGYKALVCLSSYDKGLSAIEIWDSCKKAWDRSFCGPPRLNWRETTAVHLKGRMRYRVEAIRTRRRFIFCCDIQPRAVESSVDKKQAIRRQNG
ncbi:HET-domain-containing protein [Xylaria bambusicola]|uniref:HET-domain-containing protein n=1 Tax=Xylaria bambusicola TaxID=326684 RepID=UPI0020072030|nr:HET-domain-containing protein [Xylaria bambusicola]KAI0506185.1 HET-domain-containing protein [Xylaria bambusicola]